MARRRGRRTPTSRQPGGARVAGAALAAALLAGALHAPSLGYAFVNWDDWEYVLFNPHLGALDAEFLRWCATAFRAGNWHPLTLLSYGLDHAVWGLDPTGYHLTNVLLHAANAGLVVWLAWLLFRRTLGPVPASLFGAVFVGLVFASHPLHVESVAWISERKDVLYAFFWLASLAAWLAYADAGDARRRRRAYALALACFVLSSLSKPMAVTLPLVLLLLDAWPLRRLGRGRALVRVVLVEKLPFYAVSAGTALVTLVAQVERGALGKAGLPLAERIQVAVEALAFYLGRWALPVGLVPLYPLDPAAGGTASFAASLGVLAALGGVALALRSRAPVLGVALAFYAVTLLPVLGLVEVGFHRAADRYTYLPLLGPSALLAAAAALVWMRGGARGRRIAAAAAAVLVAGLGWRTAEQLPVWRNSTSLWTHVVAAYPDSALAHYNLGHAHAVAGRAARAEAEWRRALALEPDHAPVLYELGAAAGRRRDYAEARRLFEAALAADPTYAKARIQLAMVLENLGETRAAARHYREFLRTAPPSLAEYVELARSRVGEPDAGGP